MTDAYRTDRVVQVSGGGATSALPVYIAPTTTILQPNSVLAVPPNTVTTVTTYTNNDPDTVFIDGWVGTGQFDGLWQMLIDTSFKDERRSSPSYPTIGVQYATPIRLAPGSSVDVKVEHYGVGSGQFSATIFGHKQ